MIDILNTFGLGLLIGEFPHGPIGGIALTLILSAAALVTAFPLSIAIALARTSNLQILRALSSGYVYLVRGVPLILLIFWAYFVVPLLVGYNTSALATVITALVIYEGAYLSEAIRGSIASLPPGQMEAARSLGLGYWRTQFYVVLPQVLYNALPSIISQFIMLIKDTSLAYIIGVHEATFTATQINAQLFTKPFEVYALLASIYFMICYALSKVARVVEQRIKDRRSQDLKATSSSVTSLQEARP
ncbi:amino acid ABC transporter permease [Neorhizobium sp. DT-125]|uniref:amino acid ABC transporter permease n=1 Tax=Neorhizobium sp. DT-125 TaxID=3396163 RepID=UPI003F1DAE70